MKSNYRKIGDFIQLVDERNKDLKVTKLLGLSISKQFIPSVANTIGTNMKNYKIIRKNQFACSTMQVRRDKKMPVALLQDFDEAIISQAYPVFEVIDETILNPEYLMMWFSRSEFDRHACFLAVGGVRGSLEWEDFLEMPIPIPSIEKQREIVAEYNTIVNRIKLNETLNQKLENTAQALYKHWFVDFEFPITKESCPELVSGAPELEGKPYKSSGGEMVYNEELDMEIPLGWEIKTVKDFCLEMMNGGTPNRGILDYWNSNDIPWLKTGEVENNIVIKAEEYISNAGFENSSAKLFPKETVLMAMYGATAGQLAYLKFETTTNQACCGMICKDENHSAYLYYYLLKNQEEIANMATGGAQPNLSKNIIEALLIIEPKQGVLLNASLSILINHREILTREILSLSDAKSIILSKMSKVETKTAVV
ncbi:restriction endonuclease subunit S [Bizionia paragorgiae]|uniref:restriction endonuclease subunit S n=1 Tax=Bizionia paragorgiae TaxID=283786 RepID=UPI003A921380